MLSHLQALVHYIHKAKGENHLQEKSRMANIMKFYVDQLTAREVCQVYLLLKREGLA